MNRFLTWTSGTTLSGIGLLGLALYQLSSGDYGSALQSLLAAATAFGITTGLNRQTDLKLKLERKGMI